MAPRAVPGQGLWDGTVNRRHSSASCEYLFQEGRFSPAVWPRKTQSAPPGPGSWSHRLSRSCFVLLLHPLGLELQLLVLLIFQKQLWLLQHSGREARKVTSGGMVARAPGTLRSLGCFSPFPLQHQLELLLRQKPDSNAHPSSSRVPTLFVMVKQPDSPSC